jgi:hypothetical protein
MNAEPQPFKWPPLCANENIRLLSIHPGSPESDLEASLSTFEIQASHPWPSYEALSYAWDSAELSRVIICNNVLLRLTQNLHDALRHLRRSDIPRNLWVDAICIDQTDNEERASQILYMREIFGRASRVIAWVGKEDEDVAKAMTIDFRGQSVPDAGSGFENERRLIQLVEDDQLLALTSLCSRSWFTRTWVSGSISSSLWY